jgi:hypothetical protein
MKANIENISDGGKVSANRKENAFYKQYALYALDMADSNGTPRELVCLRIYATDSRAYACIWIHGHDIYGNGGGYAGGYGYHRASAAAQEAIKNAGIGLSESIDGRGDGAIIEAIKAIAEAAGSYKYFIGEAHA